MSKTNIENFNVTFNFFGSECDVPEQEEVLKDPIDPYKPIVLRKGIISWTTKENLNEQLCSLAINDKILLQPIDEEGMDFSKTVMSFVVHDERVVPDIATRSLLLISEDVLFSRPMHKGGIVSRFEETSLYKYLNTEFKSTLPQDIQDLLVGDIQIPTAGMVFGQQDDWCNECLVMDSHEQLQLMKQRKNRIAVDKDDDLEWWWLSNKVKDEFSAAAFAHVGRAGGGASLNGASYSGGVRPAFWIRCKL